MGNALFIVALTLLTGSAEPSGACMPEAGPEYYAFPLTTTRNIPGTGMAQGRAVLSFPSSSPFPVSVASDGSYVYDIEVRIDRMKVPADGRLVAWVTTPDLDRTDRMGALDEHLTTTGTVSWNKFIVVVTLEPDDAADRDSWTGPVVFRGMSRSGAMHTMLGHGALQQENCTSYGFGG
ncbi:MAG: hypothetical protein WD995_04640 [Gemmatimonadota bacterium]